jgi:membrane protease YdiL (CAAX protease family)
MGAPERQPNDAVAVASFHRRRQSVGQFASRHPMTLFCVLAYLLSWSVFVPVVLLGAPPQFTILATFGPTLAALVTHSLATGNYRWFATSKTWWRTLGGTALGVVLVILAYVVLPAITTAPPNQLNWPILMSASVYNYSTLLGGPLGEEPGWRGYALPRLEERHGPIGGTMLLALIWTGWHLPLFLRPGWESAPLWIYVLILTGLSFIMTYTANLTRFNLISAIILHATFNTASRFLVGLFAKTQPVTSLPFELVLALCGLGVGLILIVATRGRLAYQARPIQDVINANDDL